MHMAKSDRGFTDLVAHLKKISNLDYLTEEAQLRNAANISLPDVPTTKEDITKLAGLKTTLVENKQIIINDWNKKQTIKEDEEGRPNPSNPNPNNIKSSITTAIEETDSSLAGQITKEVMNEEMRLAKIEQLQKQIEELKQQEILENTYSIEDFRAVISKRSKAVISKQ